MKRILIIKPSSMGDIIHGLLVAESIKAQMPNVAIDWVVRREFLPLVELSTVVDHTYVFHREGGLSGFFSLIKALRKSHYDAVLDMQGLARSGLLTFFSKADRKIGRFDAREGAGLFYHEKTASLAHPKQAHAVQILTGFLDVLNLDSASFQKLHFRKVEKKVLLPALKTAQRRIILFPESRRAEKNWSGYEALTCELIDTLKDTQIIWCGHVPYSPERNLESELFVNLTGKTTIDQLPELLADAACVVSNDSGPMHLAAAMSLPLVAIFGPTDPVRFGPYPRVDDRQRVLRRADGAMNSLRVEDVKRAIIEVLDD